jgi:hypothetical protein
VTNWIVAVGANLAHMGTKPRQKLKTPSLVANLTVQSTKPLYLPVLSVINAVRMRSTGLTVQVMANPEIILEQKVVRRSLRLHPVLSVTTPLAGFYCVDERVKEQA